MNIRTNKFRRMSYQIRKKNSIAHRTRQLHEKKNVLRKNQNIFNIVRLTNEHI